MRARSGSGRQAAGARAGARLTAVGAELVHECLDPAQRPERDVAPETETREKLMIFHGAPAEPALAHPVLGEEAVYLGEDLRSGVHVPQHGAFMPRWQVHSSPERDAGDPCSDADMRTPSTADLIRARKALIEARLRELNISARAASLRAGLGDTAIKAILTGRSRNPTINTLQAIAHELGLPLEALTGGGTAPTKSRSGDDRPRARVDTGAPSAVQAPDAPPPPDNAPSLVPIYGTHEAAPHGAMALHAGSIIGYAPRHSALLTMGREVFAFYMQGDSMAPWRQPGELVYVTGDRPPSAGCHVVVTLEPSTPGGEALTYVKRLVRTTAREVVLAQYAPADRPETVVLRSAIRRMLRVIEWQELLGA